MIKITTWALLSDLKVLWSLSVTVNENQGFFWNAFHPKSKKIILQTSPVKQKNLTLFEAKVSSFWQKYTRWSCIIGWNIKYLLE